MRAGRAVRADRHRRHPRRGHRLAPRPVAQQRPRRDRAVRRRPRPRASTSTTSTSPATPSTPGATTSCGRGGSRRTREPTVYAHVAQEAAYPDRLALQYWLYYPFNDWNNLHEGDWEMIQLVFAGRQRRGGARTSSRSRSATASTRAPSGRSGGTRSSSSSTGRTRSSIRPPARTRTSSRTGSSSAARPRQGVGCDDTTGPSDELRPAGALDPERPGGGAGGVPLDRVRGPLGRAPAGVLQRPDRAEPEGAVDGADHLGRGLARPQLRGARGRLRLGRTRPTSSAAPSRRARTSSCGSSTTAGASPSSLVALLALSSSSLLTRTTWRPSTPLRVGRRRSWGQTLTASWRLYISRPRLFLGIGLLVIPISLVITGLQSCSVAATSLVGIDPGRPRAAASGSGSASGSGLC